MSNSFIRGLASSYSRKKLGAGGSMQPSLDNGRPPGFYIYIL